MNKSLKIICGNIADLGVISKLKLPKPIMVTSQEDAKKEAKKIGEKKFSKIYGTKSSYVVNIYGEASAQQYIDCHYACCKIHALGAIMKEKKILEYPIVQLTNAKRYRKLRIVKIKWDEQKKEHVLINLQKNIGNFNELWALQVRLLKEFGIEFRQLGLLAKVAADSLLAGDSVEDKEKSITNKQNNVYV